MDAPDRSRPIGEMHRRTFLKTAGAAGLGAAAGIEGVLAARRAPAFAQATKVHLLQWVDFIPEGDVELRRQAAEYSKQMKVEVVVETINANDLQARITAAIQSGTGADVIMMLHNWPHLYAGGLADVSDLCEWKATDQGGYYPHSEAAAKLGKRWLALPYQAGAPLIAYRKSWFAEVGAAQPPKTLEEYRKIGIALKKKGKPVGQTLGHTFGDAPAWSYPLVWGFGGAETDASGKKVVLNSKATMESVNWMVDFWKQACDESALAWDDTNNNRAFHAGEISATLERRLDLHLRQAQSREDQGRQGRAHVSGHRALRDPRWPARADTAVRGGVLPRAHEVLEEPAGGQGVPEVAPRQGPVREVVRDRERLQPRRHHVLGEPPDVGADRRAAPGVSDFLARHAHARARGAADGEGHRGVHEVHHHGHVRQGRPGRHPPRMR